MAEYQAFKHALKRVDANLIAEWAWNTQPIVDIQTLDPNGTAGGWLSTKLIDAYTELLVQQSASNPSIIFGNTALAQDMPSQKSLTPRVKRVFQKKPEFSGGLFIFFANVTDIHWVCCVIDSPAETLRLYNSGRDDGPAQYFRKMMDVAVVAFPTVTRWKRSVEKVPKQNDGSSCGVFALQYAKCLVFGTDPNDVLKSESSTRYRVEMVYEILEQDVIDQTCLTLKDAPHLHPIIFHTVVADNAEWGVFCNNELVFKIRRSDYLARKGLVQPGLYMAGDWAETIKPRGTVGPYIGDPVDPSSKLDNGYIYRNSASHKTPIDGKQSPTGFQFMNSAAKDRATSHNVTFGNFKRGFPPVIVAGSKKLRDSQELLANYDWTTGSEANTTPPPLSDDAHRRLRQLTPHTATPITIRDSPLDPKTRINPYKWKICLLPKDPVVLRNVFSPRDMSDWVRGYTSRSRTITKQLGHPGQGWVDTFVAAAMTLEDDVYVPLALSGIVGGIQLRKASKYDMILTDAGREAIMSMAPPGIRTRIEAEVEKHKTADCPNAHYHVMVTLPQKTRVNHTDVPESDTCYRTIIVPLSKEDPQTVDPRDKLPLGGGTMFADLGVVNPYLGLVSFGGDVPHYGLGNISKRARVFLFVVINGESDAIESPGFKTQSSKTGQSFVDDQSLWVNPPKVKQLNLTLLDPPHDGDCGTHLLRMIFGYDDEYIRSTYDQQAQLISEGMSYKLMPGRYVDMNLLIAFVVAHKHNVMVFANRDQRANTFNGLYHVGRTENDKTVLLIRTIENGAEHWVGIADPNSATLSKKTVNKLQRLLRNGPMPLMPLDQVVTRFAMVFTIEEANQRGDLERPSKKPRFINMATGSTNTNPIVIDDMFGDLSI